MEDFPPLELYGTLSYMLQDGFTDTGWSRKMMLSLTHYPSQEIKTAISKAVNAAVERVASERKMREMVEKCHFSSIDDQVYLLPEQRSACLLDGYDLKPFKPLLVSPGDNETPESAEGRVVKATTAQFLQYLIDNPFVGIDGCLGHVQSKIVIDRIPYCLCAMPSSNGRSFGLMPLRDYSPALFKLFGAEPI